MRAAELETHALVWRRDNTVLRQRLGPATLLGLLAWFAAAPGTVFAQSDSSIWGAGGGPVLALSSKGELTAGWELSGLLGSPLLHFVLGGDYLRGPSKTGLAHYLAWEPGFIIGGSLGASLADSEGGLYAGAWAGLGVPSDLRTVPIADSDYSRLEGMVFTLCLGYRYNAGAHQFYLAPKLGYYEFPNPNS